MAADLQQRCPECGEDLVEGRCPLCSTGSPAADLESTSSGLVAGETRQLHDDETAPRPSPAEEPSDTATAPLSPMFVVGPASMGEFGDYEIEGELGRGGMGVVYRARQVSLNRPVALKMVKAGLLAGDSDLRRFRNEAEAVALLDHSGIVPVYEVGEHAGQCYFSMKLVEGGNLAGRLGNYRGDYRATAGLVAEIARAVHHAHMRGILHRDLKPANILVDADGHPHVTDFGLSKRFESEAETLSLGMTASGDVVGTPAYMSPEQAGGRRGSVTTATDVYGLGTILYAMLAGKAPFGGAGLFETLEAVRTRPPEPPRKADPRVPADLEAVCLKCLEKDPKRRYASADALANDLENWLDSRPIAARRSGLLERAWLWCKRRPAVAALAASVVLAVVAGTGSVFAVQSRANAMLAAKNLDLGRANSELDRERIRAVEAEGEAKERADALQKLADFQSKMLAQVDPAEAGLRLTADVKGRFDAALAKDKVPADDRARKVDEFMGLWGRVNATDAALALIDSTILKPAVEAIGDQFSEEPRLAATLRQSLGDRYGAMGLNDAAAPLLEQALKARREVLGPEHRDTIESIADLGNVLKDQEKLDESITYLREALETGRRVLGEDDRFVLNVACDLAYSLKEKGDREGAAKLYGEALGRMRRLFGEDDGDTLRAVVATGTLLKDQGKLNEAKEYQLKALEGRRRVLGPDHRDVQNSLMELGAVLIELGEYEEAIPYFREVLEKRRRLLGEVHPETLNAARNLAVPLQKAGKEEEAEALSRESFESSRRILGSDHPSTLVAMNNLAVYLIEKNKLDEAEPLCRELLERQRRIKGPDHPYTLVATNVMGYVLVRGKKPIEAEPYGREALEISRRINGDEHPDTLIYAHNLASQLMDLDKRADAEPLLREAMEVGGRIFPAGHPIPISAMLNLAKLLNMDKRFDEAEKLLDDAEPAFRKATGVQGERNLGLLLARRGGARSGLKKYDKAEADLLEAYPILAKSRGNGHEQTQNCIRAIVQFYGLRDEDQPGKGYDAKAAEWRGKLEAK